MKVAIHYAPKGFSSRWIEYCKKNGIEYKIVNAYANDIMQQVDDCDAFMWNHTHFDYRDVLFAKQLLYSLKMKGLKVFPDFDTTWHFDDKVGQKYLLEAVDAPLVPSYVFYTKKEALEWIGTTTFPKVFKLRGGAGASNVMMVHNAREARRLVNKAFGSGFPQFDRINYFKERFNRWLHGRDTFLGVCKGLGRLFVTVEYDKMHGPEKGYVYFQDYIPDNTFDIRVIVEGDKAFAVKRMCRENDFRASGSGLPKYAKAEIDERCVVISFNLAKKLSLQCIGFDFVYDSEGNPLIVEMCYGFLVGFYDKCEGYWTSDMKWHEGAYFDYCGWMVENLIKQDNERD